MKIALILERFDIERGGLERSTYEMACELTRQGMDVTIVAGRINRPPNESPLKFHEVPVKAKTRAGWWRNFERAIRQYLQSSDFDISHSMTPIVWADIYQPRGGSILYSSIRHAEVLGDGLAAKLKRLAANFNFGRAARIDSEMILCRYPDGPHIVALSNYVKQQFQKHHGLGAERVTVIRNGIDIRPFNDTQVSDEAKKLRRRYDPQNELAIFLFISQNFRLKGLKTLIEAAHRAQNNRSDNLRDFRILVIGSEDYSDYYALADRLDLTDKVIFNGPTSKVPALATMADAMVLPTYNDACSRTIMEGLAAGCPGITTRYNGAADFLDEGQFGIILEKCGDAGELASALLTLCDRQRQQKMAESIKNKKIREEVSMTRHVKQLIKLYKQLT